MCLCVPVCARARVCMRLTEQPGRAGALEAPRGGARGVQDALRQRDGVAHHGAVQPVLRHHAAAAPALLPLAPLGAPVLEPHLGAGPEDSYDVMAEPNQSHFRSGFNFTVTYTAVNIT